MEESKLLANHPSDVKVVVVRDSSTSASREKDMSQYFPSLSELVSGALKKLESEGYALADIRYSVIPSGSEYEQFTMLIGRKSEAKD